MVTRFFSRAALCVYFVVYSIACTSSSEEPVVTGQSGPAADAGNFSPNVEQNNGVAQENSNSNGGNAIDPIDMGNDGVGALSIPADGTIQGNQIINDATGVLQLPAQPYNYAAITWPSHFTRNAFPSSHNFQNAAIDNLNTPSGNSITDHGATLGRVLFYEQKLSADGQVSCASCHLQKNGFSDPRRLSRGVNGAQTRRHSMGLANASLFDSGKFFWDERAANLEQQILSPIQNPAEMDLTLNQAVDIVANQDYYRPLLRKAFGDEQVTIDRIADSLAQFIRSMVSFNARYDQARLAVASPLDPFPAFSDQENRGKQLFLDPNASSVACANCHVSEAFVAPFVSHPVADGSTSVVSNGLDAVSFADFGVFESSFNPADIGKFKAPSLRNIAVRPPYMHDGRFTSLAQVIDHYSTGIALNPGVPDIFRLNGRAVRYNFSAADKAALIAFLNTLTDDRFLSDVKYSDPFIN